MGNKARFSPKAIQDFAPLFAEESFVVFRMD